MCSDSSVEGRGDDNLNNNNNNVDTKMCMIGGKTSNVFDCAYCKYSSDKSANLSRHIRTMHSQTKQYLYCCGKQFASKADYQAHNKSSHKEGHQCVSCGKTFTRRALLKRHHSVHTGVKDFKCEFCKYASSHKSNVVRHLKIHRGQISALALVCQQEPDSTTSLSESKKNTDKKLVKGGKNVGLLRSMLKTENNQDNKLKESSKKLIKHSIESILQSTGRQNGVRPSISSMNWSSATDHQQPGETNIQQEDTVKREDKKTKDHKIGFFIEKGKEKETAEMQCQSSITTNSLLMNEASSYTRANTHSTYLSGFDINGFPVTNWPRNGCNSLSFPISSTPTLATVPQTPTPPYASPFYGLVSPSGFGSIFGLEESRYLSPPHLQSPSGLPLLTSPTAASVFRHHNNNPQRDGMMVMPELSHYFPPPLATLCSPHLFSVSTSPAEKFTTGTPQQQINQCKPKTDLQRILTPTEVKAAAGVAQSDLSGACLTFSQVSNSQMTHFVSY